MKLPPWFARPAHGFLAGVLLALLRAPLGLDWTQTAVVQGTSAALFRAAGLFVLALGLDGRRAGLRAGPGAAWVVALLAGFALQTFGIDRGPGNRAGYALLCVLGVVALRALAGAKVPTEEAAATLERSERGLLLVLGAGVALALESLAGEARLVTLGTQADEGLLAALFLALLGVGALAFGPLFARTRPADLGFPAGLALGAGLSVFGLQFLAALTPAGLQGYLARMDVLFEYGRRLDRSVGLELGLAELPPLDGAAIGTLWVTVLLGAAAFALPAFALGGALAAARSTARAAHALFGAGIGLLLRPHLVSALGEPLQGGELPAVSWTVLALGAGLAGGALGGLGLGTTRRAPWLALGLVSLALPWLRPRLACANLSPWSPRLVEPELLWPTAEGLLSVEPGRGGLPLVTLDRRRLTPSLDEQAGDALALRSSFALLAPETRAGQVRTLFVGQLTPERARVLRSLGTLELERTAPWHAAMPVVEPYLFAGEEPPGRILPPAAARARLAAGEYDWVVACGIRGPIVSWRSEAVELWAEVDAPRLDALDLPDGTVGVAWIPADSSVGRGVALGPLLVSFDALEHPRLGLVRGASSATSLPLFELGGWDGPGPLENLARMPQLRAFELERAWAAGLRCERHPALALGLARHYAAQSLSSPYETRAQQIELDEEALRAFFEAVPAPGELDLLSSALWESLAWLFLEKRQPEFALVYLEPVAERFAPWPALERSLARAYREVLEPETALRYAERALQALPEDFGLLIDAARAALESGSVERAGPFVERALELRPGREEQVRALGFLLLEAGDERGRALLEALLREHPEDEELLRALYAGPNPP